MQNKNGITLKSNRSFIKIMCIVFLIISGGPLFVVFTGWIFEFFQYEDGDFYMVLPILVVFVATVISYLFTIFYRGKKYIFTKEYIKFYKNEELIDTINLSDVDRMDYYPIRLHYIITIFSGALPDGGAPKIHLFKINGDKSIIGFISEKEAYKIKELYPEKFNIMYERKRASIQ